MKDDCSGVQIVFVSSIAQSEEWRPAVTAELLNCMLNGSFERAKDLRQ